MPSVRLLNSLNRLNIPPCPSYRDVVLASLLAGRWNIFCCCAVPWGKPLASNGKEEDLKGVEAEIIQAQEEDKAKLEKDYIDLASLAAHAVRRSGP